MRRYSNDNKEDKEKIMNRKRKSSSQSDDHHSDNQSDKSNNKEIEEKKEIFVKNLSFNTTEEELKDFLEKYGKVNRLNILQRDGRSKGIGFFQFDNPKDAENLIKSVGEVELDGRMLSFNWANEKKPNREFTDSKTKTIFVGNLSYKASEATIEDFFSDCGKILAVRIAKMSDGKSKGFCHVDFEDEEGVENALKKNDEEFEGRNIRVDKTQPRRENTYERRGGFNRDRDRGFGMRDRGSYGGRGGDRGYHGRDNYRRNDRNDRDRDRNDRNERDRSRDRFRDRNDRDRNDRDRSDRYDRRDRD